MPGSGPRGISDLKAKSRGVRDGYADDAGAGGRDRGDRRGRRRRGRGDADRGRVLRPARTGPGGLMRGFLRPYWFALSVSAALALVDTGLGLARPWPMQLAVDHAIGHRPLTGPLHGLPPGGLAVVAAAGAVALVAVSGVTGYLTSYLSGAAAERIGADLRGRAYERLLTLSPRFPDRNHRGDLVTRLTGDVSRIQDALVVWLLSAVPDALTLLGLLAVLLALDPGMTTVA